MSDPYLGEIRAISFNFAPKGWAFCNGQLLPINQNQALFALLGTQFGGNGTTTFALPDLRDRSPVHTGNGYPIGAVAGEATHTLTAQELPAHTHLLSAGGQGTASSPAGARWAASTKASYAAAPSTTMSAQALSSTGGGQPHENRPPFLVINFVIALQGIFPSQN